MKRSDVVEAVAAWMEDNNDRPLTPLCAAEAFLSFIESLGVVRMGDQDTSEMVDYDEELLK